MERQRLSPWLTQYILARGGSMYITTRMTISGWWAAYRAPSGLMGKPDDPEKYREIKIDKLQIYIDKDILKDFDKKKKVFRFVVEGYGWFRVPIQELSGEKEK